MLFAQCPRPNSFSYLLFVLCICHNIPAHPKSRIGRQRDLGRGGATNRQNGFPRILRGCDHLLEFVLALPHHVLPLIRDVHSLRQVGLLRHRHPHRRKLRPLALLWILLLVSDQVSLLIGYRLVRI